MNSNYNLRIQLLLTNCSFFHWKTAFSVFFIKFISVNLWASEHLLSSESLCNYVLRTPLVMAKTLFEDTLLWPHLSYLSKTILTDVEPIEIGHLDSMKSFDALNIALHEFQLWHVEELDSFNIKCFVWLIIDLQRLAVPLFYFQAKGFEVLFWPFIIVLMKNNLPK